MNEVFLESIEFVAPGLVNWRHSIPVLEGSVPYAAGEIMAEATLSMSESERRRSTRVIRLALQVVDQLAKQSRLDLSKTTSVFASSEGDLQVIDKVARALLLPNQPVSPVDFHNIVHNAPAGYWSIGAAAKGASTTVIAGDATFAAGYLEALGHLCVGATSVMFVCYDHPGPPVFNKYRPLSAPFAVAMMLTTDTAASHICAFRSEIIASDSASSDKLSDPALEQLRCSNPSARALPLLVAIARGEATRTKLPYLNLRSVAIDVAPHAPRH